MNQANVVIEKSPGWFMTQHGVSSNPQQALRFESEGDARRFLEAWPVKAPNARFLVFDSSREVGHYAEGVKTDYDPFGYDLNGG
jgi:hypothetical protein